MTAIAVAIAALVGIVVGVAIARWANRRDGRSMSLSDAATGSTPDVDNHDGATESLREAVEHLDIGVIVVGATGAATYRNTVAASFSGTHVGLIVDDHVAVVVAAARSGSPEEIVVELQGPPKQWLELSANPLPDGGAVVTMRDVSERMRTDTMRSDFVTNISHELKTPVGAVAVLAEALIDEPDPTVVRRLSDHLVDEAHRAVRTIDDLLKLSEIEAAVPVDQVVDLTSVVDRAVARGRTADAGRGIEVVVGDLPDHLLIRGDDRQLVSAVGNLVENAVKYSRAGGVVRVATRADAAGVEVTVTDQGIGIPRRDLDRVFERFYRVDRARSRETGGTGLGLAIVRHVATNHGGEVLVSSQEGEGSTFVLRLPTSVVVEGDRTGELEQEQHE
jgi:two-component system sensor histidine kinase SenX3